jgi:hypothetical protein
MAEALAKPSVNNLTVTYNGSNVSGNTSQLITFYVNVIGVKLSVDADLVDTTSGVDTSRRWSKTNLVKGSLQVTGYMTADSVMLIAACVSEETTTGSTIVLNYGNATSSKTLYGVIEHIEFNSNKTQAYIGVAISFRLGGAAT